MEDIALSILNYDDIIDYVRHDLHWVQNNTNLLKEEQFPPKILGYLVDVIITRGYWRTWPREHLLRKLKKNRILVVVDKQILIKMEEFDKLFKIINELFKETKKRYWKETLFSLQALLRGLHRAGSLREWISTLYTTVTRVTSNQGGWKEHEYFKGIKGLGRKSVEIILRDMGYFDRVPIDIHERRFLLRTGIALIYGPPSKDPALPDFYSEALTNYCKENLKGIELEGVSLDSAPGVLDWAIWYFSCEKELKKCKAICSSNPKCDECPLRNMCFYGKYSKRKANGFIP